MNQRSILKEASLLRILEAGAARLREEGTSGAGIVPVMHDAGLTSGAFYSHFANKDELVVAAFQHALTKTRPRWIGRSRKESWAQRLLRLANRYLTTVHRDDLAESCAFAALASDAARANPEFRRAYEEELSKSLKAICDVPEGGVSVDPERFDQAIVFMALCVGGISLARAVDGEAFSNRILTLCRNAAARIAALDNHPTASNDHDSDQAPSMEEPMENPPKLDQFPLKTYEKLRYADTDRQGHVNNAVFSSMLETGRVEVLYDPGKPLASADCSFVIASLTLNFRSEITWPGQVEIGTRVSNIGRSSVNLEQALFQNDCCVATANTVIVQMNNATRLSQPFSETAAAQLASLMHSDPAMAAA